MIKISPSCQVFTIIIVKEDFMSILTKEQVKQIIRGNNLQSVTDVSRYF